MNKPKRFPDIDIDLDDKLTIDEVREAWKAAARVPVLSMTRYGEASAGIEPHFVPMYERRYTRNETSTRKPDPEKGFRFVAVQGPPPAKNLILADLKTPIKCPHYRGAPGAWAWCCLEAGHCGAHQMEVFKNPCAEIQVSAHITMRTCDCGAAKAKTTHVSWCSTQGKP